jgi:hypothetical protein
MSKIYNLKYLELKLGKFYQEYEYPSQSIFEGKLLYIEKENKKELDAEIQKLKENNKIPAYIWGFTTNNNAIYVSRATGENKIFIYNPEAIKRTDYVKGKLKVLDNLNEDTFDDIFEQKAVFDYFYKKLWDLRLELGREIRDKNKLPDNISLMEAQHIIDRIIFTYFICEKELVCVKGNVPIIGPITGKQLFSDIIANRPDPWEYLKKLFFEQFANKDSEDLDCGGGVYLEVIYLNGGLFREKELNKKKIKETQLKIDYDWTNIFNILNTYTWIIEDTIPDIEIDEIFNEKQVDEDNKIEYQGNLTPEVIGHIYEKFVISLEELSDVKIDELKITKSGDLKKGNKKIGAYYTPEYITNYISRNVITNYLLNNFDTEKTTFEQFLENLNQEELNKSLDILNKIKICDPAAGSGAFLVKAGEILLDYKLKIINKINNLSFEKYALIKDIIINNLYGVDIQEGAIEICKLRLWLWLISSAKNEDVEPLPNIEYNFVMGNSLIGWTEEKIKQRVLIQVDESHIRPLITLKGAYKYEQRKIIDQVIELLGNIDVQSYARALSLLKSLYSYCSGYNAEILKEVIEWTRSAIYEKVNGVFYIHHKLKGYIPYDVYEKGLKPFHWKVDFHEVFEKGGFDIIIGNPPYLSFQIGGKAERDYLKKRYKTPYRNYDIYIVFAEKGINILKDSGEFGYIMPNKFINSQYGDKLKEFLNDFFVRELIDFDDTQIFDSVKNYTCILLVTKKNITSETLYLEHINEPEKALSEFLEVKSIGENYRLLEIEKENFQKWELIDKKELEIFYKLNKFSKLQNLTKNIYEGSRPGYEKAYIVNKNQIDTLGLETDIIRPFIKSENVDDFVIDWKGINNDPKYVIFPYKENESCFELINLDKYPKIKEYLEGYKTNLYDSEGTDDSKLRYKYYHLPKELKGDLKLICPDISKTNEFALSDDSKLIFPNTLYAIDLKPKFRAYKYELLGILNSKLLEFYIKIISPNVRGGYFRYKSEYLEQLPIIDLEKVPIPFKEIIKSIGAKKEEEMEERRTFISGMQKEWGVNIEDLSRKSYLKEYWKYNFDKDTKSFFNVAKNNKSKIKVDITSDKFRNNLEIRWKNSVHKLKMLELELQDLKNQMDALIFKLYDLNENEIETILNVLLTDRKTHIDIMNNVLSNKIIDDVNL